MMMKTFLLQRHLKSCLNLFCLGFLVVSGAATSAWGDGHNSIQPLVQGDPNSAVHVIEFVSYTCPHCASFHNESYGELKRNYIDTDKIKFEVREVIWDQSGFLVSVIGRCGKTENFFSYIDLVFAKQNEWTRLETLRDVADRLKSMAVSVGYDSAAIDMCIADKNYHTEVLENSVAMAAELGISSTPSFAVNGKLLNSFRGYQDLVTAIEARLN